MDPAGAVVVGVGGGVVGAGPEVAGAALVAEEAEQNGGCTSHIWGSQEGLNNWGEKVGRAPTESKGRQRRHGTLRSAPPGHGGPGG
jgi:hypothetical protein